MKIPEDHLRFHTSHGKKTKNKQTTSSQGRSFTHLSASKLPGFFADHVYTEEKKEPRKLTATWLNKPSN